MKQLIIKLFPFIRIFTEDKLVRSRILNAMGLQVMRMKLAHYLYTKKKYEVPNKLVQNIELFRKNGILQINNFLEADEFEKFREECIKLKNTENLSKFTREQGPNMMYNPNIYELELEKYPVIKKVLKNETLNSLFKTLEKKELDISDKGNKTIAVQLQYLVQGPENGKHDPETDLHADTFFNTHKAWIYLDDVNVENGPFVFVPTSHDIYLKGRLDREKAYSKDINAKGSRRVDMQELMDIDLQENVYTCKKNTLVIANTLGYHRRLRGKEGNDRLTFAISARSNPFFN